MRLLLDTHAFLYWASSDRRLPRKAKSAIARPRTDTFISVATIWEIRIKVAKGRLRTDFENVADEARKHDFDIVAITADHAQAAGDLPLHHDDPFDRMLVAQSRIAGMTLVTGDSLMEPYGVPIIWD